jgi:acyl transferase domain-containing protein
MASGAEILAVKNGDLGTWLVSLGMHELVGGIEDMGADTPHDLLFLEQDDIDSVVTSPEQCAKLMAAVHRIEGIESGEISAEAPPDAAPLAAATANVELEHGHMLQLHRVEIEQEKQARISAENRADVEGSARAAAERRAAELDKAVADMKAKQSLPEQAKRSLGAEKDQEASSAQAAARRADTEAKARAEAETQNERLVAALREAEARAAAPAAAVAPASAALLAVVGVACRFSHGANPAEFWGTLESGTDAITVGPTGRWDVDAYFDPDDEAPGKTYSKWGGFIDDVDMFEPSFFSISSRECKSMDRQQRLLLECSWEALEDAGVVPSALKDQAIGVFLGIQNYDFFRLLGTPGHHDELDAYFGTGQSHSVAVGRLSFILGLKGPSIPVDTACSSALVAAHLATESLRAGDSREAFIGGVNLMLAPEIFVNLSKAHMLSPTGRCHTYDADADGYVRGEGCGVVYVKTLAAAVEDHSTIHSLIIGAACNHDGFSSGLTVPSGPAQQMVIRAAQKNAQIGPDDVSCIESHGTGTKLGDPIEIGAITAVFAGRTKPLLIGTVKTNVGHLEASAGLAGIMKAVLSLEHGSIPAHLHLKKLNPFISFGDVPITIPNALTPWPANFPRHITGCSGFGFGGTNGHVMLESPPTAAPPSGQAQEWQLFALSSQSETSLGASAHKIGQFLGSTSASLSDICFTMTKRTSFGSNFAVAVNSKAMLQQELAKFASNSSSADRRSASAEEKVAFVFADVGSQYPAMGQGLYRTQKAFKDSIDLCDRLLANSMGSTLLSILYGRDASKLSEQKVAETVTFVFEYALSQMWLSFGVKPAVVIGHGVGQYVAACVAGIFSVENALKLVPMRGQQMFGMLTKMVQFNKPQIPVITGTGQLVNVSDGTISVGDYWIKESQLSAQFTAGIESACGFGVTSFVEIGPDDALASRGKDSLSGSGKMVWVSSLTRGQDDGKCTVGKCGIVDQLRCGRAK